MKFNLPRIKQVDFLADNACTVKCFVFRLRFHAMFACAKRYMCEFVFVKSDRFT